MTEDSPSNHPTHPQTNAPIKQPKTFLRKLAKYVTQTKLNYLFENYSQNRAERINLYFRAVFALKILGAVRP